MEFTLRFTMDNDAFADRPEQEVDRILRDVGTDVLAGDTSAVIRDVNGNTIGGWQINE